MGTLHPSVASPGRAPERASRVARLRRWTGWSGRWYPSAGAPRARAAASIPACFPEQLWCRGVGARPWASRAARASREKGGWTPQTRCSGPSPSFPRKRAATSTCRGVPSWLAVAKATSSSVRPKRSTAPVR